MSDNRESLQARIGFIENATSEISLACYAIDTGDVPIGLFELLRQAASRGVRVRVLADGLKSRLPTDFEKLLVHDGVQLRLYHPPYQGNPKWLNRRLHSKLLVVDRQVMIIGSRNLQDHHFALDEFNYVDCDAWLSGNICRSAADYFDLLWSCPDVSPVLETNSLGIDLVDTLRMVVPMGFSISNRRVSVLEEASRTSLIRLRCIAARQPADRDFWRPDAVNVQACLIHDRDTHKSQRQVQRQVVAMIDSAQCTLLIESPYPVLAAAVRQALERAASRGVDIVLLTNSLQTSRLLLPYAGYQNDKAALLRSGVRLYEYVGRDHFHVKTMIVDDRITMLGSYNFDERSDNLNLEIAVRIDDPQVASIVRQSVCMRLQAAKPVNDNLLHPEIVGDVPVLKRARMRVAQTVVPLLRKSL